MSKLSYCEYAVTPEIPEIDDVIYVLDRNLLPEDRREVAKQRWFNAAGNYRTVIANAHLVAAEVSFWAFEFGGCLVALEHVIAKTIINLMPEQHKDILELEDLKELLCNPPLNIVLKELDEGEVSYETFFACDINKSTVTMAKNKMTGGIIHDEFLGKLRIDDHYITPGGIVYMQVRRLPTQAPWERQRSNLLNPRAETPA